MFIVYLLSTCTTYLSNNLVYMVYLIPHLDSNVQNWQHHTVNNRNNSQRGSLEDVDVGNMSLTVNWCTAQTNLCVFVGTIFRLRGSILAMSFLDWNGILIPAMAEHWRDDTKEEGAKKTYTSEATSHIVFDLAQNFALVGFCKSIVIDNVELFSWVCRRYKHVTNGVIICSPSYTPTWGL